MGSSLNLLIFFLFYHFCYLKLSKVLNLYDKNLIEQYYFEKSINENSNTSLFNIQEAVNLFPFAYLTFIIKQFLPNETYKENNIASFLMETSCFKEYKELFINKTNRTQLYNTIRYSGKSYPDFGNEEGCIEKKNSFILISILFNVENPNDYDGKYQLLPFVSNGHSFYGLCLKNIDNCTTQLVKDFGILNNKFLSNSSYTLKTFIHRPDENSIKKNSVIPLVLIIIIAYILIRIIIGIFGQTFFKEDNLNKNKNLDDSSSDEEEEEEEDENEEKIKHNQGKEGNNSNSLLIEKASNAKILINKEKYPKLYFFYKLCSIKNALKLLFEKNGNLYDETDLYLVIFFKAISLLLKTFYMNIFLMIKTPSKELNNISFFESSFMNIIKYCSFSDIIFIITESIIVAYKLMSFIRKYKKKNEEPSILLFLNFFLRVIPSFSTLFICFFIIYFMNIPLMEYLLSENVVKKTRIQHFNENLIKCYSCINDIKGLLIPFYMHYQNFTKINMNNKECFQFMIIMVNMFYCYLFVILLIFISYKIKNTKFDYSILIIFILYYIFPNNFLCYNSPNRYFNIDFLFGETYTTKYTHLFIKYYFIGFLIGLSIFYNNDITHENSMRNSQIYKPFYFLQDLIGFIYLKSFIIKILIIILMIVVQALLSFFIYFAKNNIAKPELKKKVFTHFLYLNEKIIFALAFGIMLIVLYTFKNESIIKGISNNILFIIFNRIAYGYYSIIEIMINYIYCFIELEIQLSTVNFLYISYGIIFYIMILNIILTILNELPVKLLTKRIFQLNSNERKASLF